MAESRLRICWQTREGSGHSASLLRMTNPQKGLMRSRDVWDVSGFCISLVTLALAPSLLPLGPQDLSIETPSEEEFNVAS